MAVRWASCWRLNEPWPRLALFLGLMAAALVLRLHGLGDKPFWLDELLTHRRATMPLGELAADAFRNRHFPGYFLMLRAFMPLDAGEWGLRLPSAIFGAMAVGLAGLVAVEAAGYRAGIAAGALLALSPFDVQFGQEARPYTLAAALILLALWGLLRLAGNARTAAVPLTQPGAPLGAYAAYTFGTAAALSVLNVAVPWFVAANIAMAVLIWRWRGSVPGLARNWLLVQGFILLLWLPLLLAMYRANSAGLTHGIDWVPAVTGQRLWSTIAGVYLFRVTDLLTLKLLPSAIPALGLIVGLLALLGIWRLRRYRVPLLLVGLAALAMPLTVAGASLAHSLLVPRYLLWSAGPVMVLAGVGLTLAPPRGFAIGLAALVLAGGINLAPYYQSETKPRWDLAATRLAADLAPGDTILVESNAVRFTLAYYLRRHNADPSILILGADNESALARHGAGGRVWVVYGRVGQGVMEPPELFFRKGPALGPSAQHLTFGRNIVIERFDPSGALALAPEVGTEWPRRPNAIA